MSNLVKIGYLFLAAFFSKFSFQKHNTISIQKIYSPDIRGPALSDGLVHKNVNAGLVRTPELRFEESLGGLEALAPHL